MARIRVRGTARTSRTGRRAGTRPGIAVGRRAAVAAAALAAAIAVVSGGWGGAARGDGLDFTCAGAAGAGGGAAAPVSVEPVVGAGVVLTFDGEAPDGTTVHRDLDVLPVGLPGLTGGPAITYASGAMRPVDVDGDGSTDLHFGFGIRTSTAPPDDAEGSATGASPLQNLMNENFAVADDFRSIFGAALPHVFGPGVDLRVAQVPGRALGEYGARFGIRVDVVRADGTRTSTLVRVGVDALDRPGWVGTPRLPDETRVGIFFKGPVPDRPESGFWGVAQEFVYADLAPGAAAPPLATTLDVTETNPDGTPLAGPAGIVDLEMPFAHAPADFALGAGQVCVPAPGARSTAHLAWNRPTGSGNNTVGLDLRTGEAQGLPIKVWSEGPNGVPVITDGRADETVVEATVTGIPQRLDWIMHPDSLSLTRTLDHDMDVTLERLQLAADDPAAEDDRPLHVTGTVTDVPEHVLVTADFPGGELARARASFWNLACPDRPDPPGEAAPPEEARPDLADTLPLYPAGCARHAYMTADSAEVVVKNWVPGDYVHTGVIPQPPAAGTGEYVLYGSREVGDTLELTRFGARLSDVAAFEYDTTAAPAGGTRLHAGVRRYPPRVLPPLPCDLPPELCPPGGGGGGLPGDVRLLVGIDGRTDPDPAANRGTLLQATATLVRLPANVAVDLTTAPGTPAAVAWSATDTDGDPAAVAVADGHVAVALPGAEAVAASSGFETGEGDGGGLPASGSLEVRHVPIRITIPGLCFGPPWLRTCLPSRVIDTGDVDGAVAYRASGEARLTVGATLSTLAQRTAASPVRTRVHVDASVPASLDVAWREYTGAGGDGLRWAEARLCPLAPGCDDRVDVTAVHGPPRADDDDLLDAPPLPALPVAFGWTQPPFTDRGNGQGLKAVLRAGTWGVSASVRDVVSARYETDPQTVALVTHQEAADPPREDCWEDPTRGRVCWPRSANGPFVANVYDATDPDRPLYADAVLTGLPEQLRVQILDTDGPGGGDEPWLWVNTEDAARTRPPAIADHDDSGGRYRLDAVVRTGDPGELFALRDAARTRDHLGADAAVRLTRARGGNLTWGLHAVAAVDLPRHVEIWQPEAASCDAASRAPAPCHDREAYEPDEWRRVGFRAETSMEVLGDLDAAVHYQDPGAEYDVTADVERVPGSLRGSVELTENRRLPWTEASADLEANTALGTITVSVYDRRHPAHVGDDANAADPGNRVPNYRFALRGVGETLHVWGRMRDSETTAPPAAGGGGGGGPCAGYERDPARAEAGLGYIDADVDLGGAERLDLDVRRGKEDPLREDNSLLAARLHSDAPVTGNVRARLANVLMAVSDDTPAPFPLPGESEFDACLDFDLPLDLRLDGVRDILLGYSGARVVLDLAHADRVAGGDVSVTVHEEYDCTAGCPGGVTGHVDRLGAPYAHREVRFDPVGPELWVVGGGAVYLDGGWHESGTGWKDVGIIPTGNDCDDLPCYADAADNVATFDDLRIGDRDDDLRSDGDVANFDSAAFGIDVFWTPGMREIFDDRDDSPIPGRPGGEFYKALLRKEPLPTDYRIPDVRTGIALTSTMRDVTPACEGMGYSHTTQESARLARTPDGTRYTLLLETWCGGLGLEEPVAFAARPTLVARHPGGAIRWTRTLARSDFNRVGGYTYRATLTPRADGSVVVLLSLVRRDRVLRWDRGLLDASGQGPLQTSAVRTSSLTADRGAEVTFDTDRPLPAGSTRTWYLGDGEVAADPAETRTRTYNTAGDYLVLALDRDAAGNLTGFNAWRLTVRFTLADLICFFLGVC